VTWRRPHAGLVAVLALAGCAALLSSCSNPSVPNAELNQCTGTSDSVANAISQKLDKNAGHLRNVKQVTHQGITFISAELHAPGDKKHDKGDILTWAADTPKDPTDFTSVDVHAREKSAWPGAKFDVRKAGAYASRACTDITRGKTKAQVECEQQNSSGANGGPAIAVNNKHCENL
jgi:hypothetical protein